VLRLILVGRPCAKNKLVPYISAQTMLVGETANSTRRNRSSTLHQHGIDRFVAPVTVHQLSSRLLEIVREVFLARPARLEPVIDAGG